MTTRPVIRIRIAGLVIALALLPHLSLHAAAVNRTWDGGGATDNWSNSANWSPNGNVATGDSLSFAGFGPLVTTNDFAAGFLLGNITFSSPGFAVYGNALSLSNGITTLGAIGPIEFHPAVTLTRDQTITVSRFNAALNLRGAASFGVHQPTVLAAGTVRFFGPVSGTDGLLISSGSVALHETNTLSGTATVNNGVLDMLGVSADLTVRINPGGTLTGNGRVRRIQGLGGVVDPGGSGAGGLRADLSMTMNAASKFHADLNGTSAGVTHDQVSTPDASLGNATLELKVGAAIALGQEFRIVNNTSRATAITGTFGGLPEGSSINAGGVTFQITYKGGTGNDVVLTAMSYQPGGVTHTWDGGGADGYWSTPQNWVGDEAPLPGDSLVFKGAVRQVNTNDFADFTQFTTINLNAEGFHIHGNPVLLINQLSGTYFSGQSTFGPFIRLADGAFANFLKLNDPTGSLVVSGDIDLNGAKLTLICEGEIQLSGAIFGEGSLSKGKDKPLRLSGGAANTFAGETVIFGGGCRLEKTGGALAVPGNLIIGNPQGSVGHVLLLGAEQINNASTVTVMVASSLDLGAFNETIGSLCLTGGVVTAAGGTLTVLGQIEVKSSAATASISASLALGGPDTAELIVANGTAAPDLDISAVVSGGSGVDLHKTGSGELRFSGIGANTYLGLTVVHAGTLALAKPAGAAAVPGSLEIGHDAPGLPNSARVRLEANHQIANNAVVTIGFTGRLDLNGHSELIGPLNMEGGAAQTGAGVLTLGGTLTAPDGGGASTLLGKIDLGSGGLRVFSVEDGASLQVDGILTGGAGITLAKTGAGSLELNASNLFQGPLILASGTLIAKDPGSFGGKTSGTTLQGGTLKLVSAAGLAIGGETLTVQNPATLMSEGASAAWLGSVVLQADLSVNSTAPVNLGLVGVISGAGGLTKSGTGTLTMKGPAPNTHTGTNRVVDGVWEIYKFLNGFDTVSLPGEVIVGDGVGAPGSAVLRYGGPGQLGDHSGLTIQVDGEVFVQGWRDTVGSLAGDGQLDLGLGGGASFGVGAADVDSTFTGLISGMGGLTKVGLSTLTLMGNNTHQGDTTVSNGTLIVNGSISNSTTRVEFGGTLGGTGVVQRIVARAGGRLSPGASPGVLHSVGIALLASNAIFRVELAGAQPGSGYDQFQTSAGVDLRESILELVPSFQANVGDIFRILNKTGAGQVIGTFHGLPEAAEFTAGDQRFRISYAGGDGNDVTLERVRVVQPVFGKVVNLGEAGIQLNAVVEPGASYIIQAAEDLGGGAQPLWVEISRGTASRTGAIEFTDSRRERLPRRFYRLLLETGLAAAKLGKD